MTEFESLGDNCEFGWVQRYCGAEPLGLFRFNGSEVNTLARVVTEEFDEFMSEEDAIVYVEQWDQEYFLRSHKGPDFHFHTYRYTHEIKAEDLLAQELRKLRFLKRQFRENLVDARKIYVRKGDCTWNEIRALHAALRQFGPNQLLWIKESRDPMTAGKVELLEDGLAVGTVTRFKRFDTDDPIDVEAWLAVCRKAYRLFRDDRASFPTTARVLAGSAWSAEHACSMKAAAGARLGRGATTATFLGEGQDEDAIASVALDVSGLAGAIFTVTAWILVPADLQIVRVRPTLDAGRVLATNKADLSIRDRWQRVWISAKLPATHEGTISFALRGGGGRGQGIVLGAWEVGRGSVPRPQRRLAPRARRTVRLAGHSVRFALRRATSHVLKVGPGKGSPVPEQSRVAHAEALIADRLYIEADRFIGKHLRVAPRDAALLKLFARSAQESGRQDSAVARWREALAVDADDAAAHANLAIGYLGSGQVWRARDTAAEAMRCFPDHRAPLVAAARVATQIGGHAEALDFWERALASGEERPEWIEAREQARLRLAAVS